MNQAACSLVGHAAARIRCRIHLVLQAVAPRSGGCDAAAMSRLLLAASCLLVAGCTSLQRYGTARTLAPSEVSVHAAVDVVEGYEPQLGETFDAALPAAPRLGVRFGVAGWTEVGLELAPVHGTFDVKQQLVRSSRFDLALAPALTAGWIDDTQLEGLVLVQLPVLFGIHATDWLTVVPQVSAGYGWREAERLWPEDRAWQGSALVGGGLGLFLRIADAFALQPLVGITFEPDSGYRYTSGGLALFYGAQPGRGAR